MNVFDELRIKYKYNTYRETIGAGENVRGRNAHILEHHVARDARAQRQFALDDRRSEAARAALDEEAAD